MYRASGHSHCSVSVRSPSRSGETSHAGNGNPGRRDADGTRGFLAAELGRAERPRRSSRPAAGVFGKVQGLFRANETASVSLGAPSPLGDGCTCCFRRLSRKHPDSRGEMQGGKGSVITENPLAGWEVVHVEGGPSCIMSPTTARPEACSNTQSAFQSRHIRPRKRRQGEERGTCHLCRAKTGYVQRPCGNNSGWGARDKAGER